MPGRAAIVILTGAGISAESGLPTFRGAGGLWEGQRVEDVATPRAFARDPERVLRFYDARRRALGGVRPNPAHLALARLERAWNGPFLLVTQNVDDLHERAGSLNLVHMHTALARYTLFAAIGTSGRVWPAAGFVERALAAGAHTVELNLEPSETSDRFAERRPGPASRIVPAWVEELVAAGRPG
ncbi:MAG: NAD-dependent protein deacylase [Geminicoccaceae bacterium]|nr:NAD-dependent protein deacylase [Geminicoccaceae bacterium]